jgi:hypothetical protein
MTTLFSVMSQKERRYLLTDLERLVELSASQNAHQKLANSTPCADRRSSGDALALGDLTRGNLNRTVSPYDSRQSHRRCGLAYAATRLHR